jgi:hypothetical protein
VAIMVDEMSTDYEQAFVDSSGTQLTSSYSLAWGLFTVLSEPDYAGQLLPDQQQLVRNRLGKMAASLFADVVAHQPADAEHDTGTISSVSDDLTELAHIDTTAPEPTKQSVGQLRAAAGMLAVMRKDLDAGNAGGARSQLHLATVAYTQAAGSVASVDSSILGTLDHEFGIELPAAVAGSAPPTSSATSSDTAVSDASGNLDQARSEISQELAGLQGQ